MYQISEKENLTISEVVKERAELLIERKRKDWTHHVLEKFELRLKFLDDLIVEEFLDHYEP